jgi:hypothetical protein
MTKVAGTASRISAALPRAYPDQRHHRHQQRGHKGKDQCEMAEFGNH